MHPVFDERRYLIPYRASLLPQIFTDVLVIGAGVAGMRAALAAADSGADVILTTKADIKNSNTWWAQGGIAAVVAEDDNFESHIEDTLIAGAGLCDEPVVRRVVEGAPAQIDQLRAWGMRFDREGGIRLAESSDSGPPIALGREGGHSAHRILHADGDATGKELAFTLDRQVRQTDRIRFFENCFVIDLITSGDADPVRATVNGGQCLGAITHHPKYGLQVIWASATVLASGGSGQVYRESTNPAVATGDGLAMAYRAGAELADMAFVQFHPTTLYVAGASRSLITEAVRGEGGRLIDRNGYRFMSDYDERGELAPRDIVSRAILAQMVKTGATNAFLDVRHLGGDWFKARFPSIYAQLQKFDIDPGQQPIPVHPSAHYMIGGVRTDDLGRSNVAGLWACGEASASGLHGANRLASNSLLEGLVLGEIVGRACCEGLSATQRTSVKVISDIRLSERSELDLADVRSSLRSVMWRHVGIERDGGHLKEVAGMFEFWARYTMDKIFDDRGGWEVQNLLTVGALITHAALWREESRGTHARTEWPVPRDEFRVHDVWRRGEREPTTQPVLDAPVGAKST